MYFSATASFSKVIGLAEKWVEFLCRLEESLTIRAGFGLVIAKGENISNFLSKNKEWAKTKQKKPPKQPTNQPKLNKKSAPKNNNKTYQNLKVIVINRNKMDRQHCFWLFGEINNPSDIWVLRDAIFSGAHRYFSSAGVGGTGSWWHFQPHWWGWPAQLHHWHSVQTGHGGEMPSVLTGFTAQQAPKSEFSS